MVLQQTSQHSQHQSTARIRVPSGPFGLAEQGLLLLFPLPNFSGRVATLGIYSILITNLQQIFVEDTIKSCSIPSVPSGLEEVKTRPQLLILFSSIFANKFEISPPRDSLTHAISKRSQLLILFLLLQIDSKSHHGGIQTDGRTLFITTAGFELTDQQYS